MTTQAILPPHTAGQIEQLKKQRHQAARMRYTPKEKKVEIYGWIYDVLYGKFSTNTKTTKMGTYAIVEFRILKSTIEGLRPKSRVIVKGDFPYQSCYFKYRLSCLPVWNEKETRWDYELHDIIKIERDAVMTARALEWIAVRELKAQRSLFDTILDDLIPGIPRGRIMPKTPVNMATQKSHHWFWEKSYPATEWYRWSHDKMLSNLFPGGTNTLFNDVYSSIVVPAIVNLTKDENESWRLCFKQTCRTIAPYMKDFSHRVSKENRGSLAMKPEYANAIDFYFDCIRIHRKKKRSTSFRVTRADDIVKADILCNPMGMLVKEKIYEEIFYTFKKDYDVQCELISIYNAIWSNEVDKINQQQNERNHRSSSSSSSSTVTSFKRNNAQVVVKRDYVPTSTLTADQTSAIDAVSKKPILNVVGLPGRGKSIVIREIFKKYENVFVVTRMASMAAELKESFGIATDKVTTTESAICRYDNDVYKKELADVRILVIDEYEDLDDKSILRLLKGPFSNIVRIVHVFDPEQIRPMKPGSMAQDFLFATDDTKPKHRSGFKKNPDILQLVHSLTTPWRFQSAFARKTDENDRAIIDKKWENVDCKRFDLNDINNTRRDWDIEKELKFSRCGYPTFSFSSSAVIADKGDGGDGGGNDEIGTQNTLRRIMTSMNAIGIFDDVETFGSPADKKAVVPAAGAADTATATNSQSTILHIKRADIQCIALRKKSVSTLNAFFEKKYNPNGYAFYSGQRVIVDGTNFNQTKPLLSIRNDSKKGAPRSKPSSKKTNGAGGDSEKSEHRKTDGANVSASHVAVASKRFVGGPDHDHCDIFKNGETCVVDYIVDFDATIYATNAIRIRWKKDSKRQYVAVDDIARYDFEKVRRCIVMTNGKIMCIHPSYIEKMHVLPAWAITVDKSKGRTFGNVIFAVGGEKDTVFTKNHVHVALTRAKGLTMIAGDLSILRKIVMEEEECISNDSKRLHHMRWRLRKWWRKEAGRKGDVGSVVAARDRIASSVSFGDDKISEGNPMDSISTTDSSKENKNSDDDDEPVSIFNADNIEPPNVTTKKKRKRADFEEKKEEEEEEYTNDEYDKRRDSKRIRL